MRAAPIQGRETVALMSFPYAAATMAGKCMVDKKSSLFDADLCNRPRCLCLFDWEVLPFPSAAFAFRVLSSVSLPAVESPFRFELPGYLRDYAASDSDLWLSLLVTQIRRHFPNSRSNTSDCPLGDPVLTALELLKCKYRNFPAEISCLPKGTHP